MISTISERIRNTGVYGPHGAHKVLAAIDYDRLFDTGLATKVVLYLGNNNTLTSNFSVKYEGKIRFYGQSRDIIVLPTPLYSSTRFNKPQFELPLGEMPLEFATGAKVGRIELVISATNDEDYLGLKQFVDVVVPAFFREGYVHYNSGHESTAWLHVGDKNPMETTVFHIAADGLTIHNTKMPDGRKILTEFEVKRLCDLKL